MSKSSSRSWFNGRSPSGHSQARWSRKLHFAVEQLENRRVLATLDITGGALTYTAAADETNQLVVSLVDGVLQFSEAEGNTINLTGAETAAWSGGGTNVVSGPADSVTAASQILLENFHDTLTIESFPAVPLSAHGGPGNDTLAGSSGNDRLYGDDGNDVLTGGDGDDTLYGHAGDDRLYGYLGNDELHGGAGNDRLNGAQGNDRLHGEAGNDFLDGNLNNDVYLFDADADLGSDIISEPRIGGGGADRMSFYSTTNLGVLLDLGKRTPQQVNANLQLTFVGIDQVTGSGQGDILVGNRENNRFSGGNGNDVLVGNGGADLLEGQNGRDILVGGDYPDVPDNLIGGGGSDILIGGSTIYYGNVTPLQALMAEWSSDNSYRVRIDHLTGATSGGLNGDYTLHGGPNTSATVFDDGFADILTGDDYYDWFLGRAEEPTDKVEGETLTII